MIQLLHFFKTEVVFKYKGLTSLLLITFFLQLHLYSQIKNITKEDGLTSLNVTCSLVDSRGIVWIGTNDGLNAYAGSKWYAITSIEDSKSGKAENLGRIETIFEDSEGRIWVSVMDKIFLYYNSYWTVFAETEIDDYVAKSFYEDKKGWIWVMLEHFKDFSDIPEIKFSFLGGTLEMFNGVNWYKFDGDVAGTAAYSGQGIPRYYTNMIQKEDSSLWLGSLKGVYKFDGTEWAHFDKSDIVSEKVLHLLLDSKGILWAGTEYGISYRKEQEWFKITKKDGLCGPSVYNLEEDPQGRVWAFTRNNLRFSGLNLFENGQLIAFDRRKTKLKSTIEQLIWQHDEVMAFAKDGVSLYDTTGKWKHFGKVDGLIDSKFYKILKDSSGIIWLAGASSLYQYENHKWKQLREANVWTVSAMLSDRNGVIWIGTEKNGLYRYSGDNWTHYANQNGLIDNEIIELFEDSRGNIWTVTKKGISIVSGE